MITCQQVNRLGFDAWASNKIANVIEDGFLFHGYKFENNDYFLAVTKFNKRYLVTVRAYVESMGWQIAEIVI